MKRFRFPVQLTALLLILLTGCGGANTTSRAKQSPHFQTVSSHLDLGGVFYLYADINGDLQRGAELVNEAVRSSGEFPEDFVAKLDAVQIARDFGLTGVTALGLSSVKDGDTFVNKGFIHIPGGRTGLLNAMGRDPHPFDVLTMAPADSAMILERDVNVKVAMDLVTALFDDLQGPEKTNEMMKELSRPIPLLGYSPREIIDMLDTRVIAVVKLDDSKTMPVPDFKSRMPMVHAVIAADNLGSLLEPLLKEEHGLPSLRRESRGDWDTVELMEPIDRDVPDLRPVLRRHRPTNRLYFATDLGFLEDCLNGGPSISSNASFIKAARDMPIDRGNGIFYGSPEFFAQTQTIIGDILDEDKDTRWLKGILAMVMPGVKTGEIGVSINEPDGISFISRSSFSHKVTLIEGLYLNPLMLGALFYVVAHQAFSSANDIANPLMAPTEAWMKVEVCYWGAVRYYEAHQTLPQSVDWTPALAPSSNPYPPVPEDWQNPTWQALEFSFSEPHMYQYSFVYQGNEFSCSARGDLDADGVFSLFERRGIITEEGYVEEVGGLVQTLPEE